MNNRSVEQALYREDFVGLDHPEAEFIAHAREDIDFLLDRVKELEAERRSWATHDGGQ